MKRYTLPLLLLLLVAVSGSVQAQPRKGKGYSHVSLEILPNGDTLGVVHVLPIYVFDKRADLRKYQKLVAAVKRVYPVAKIARAKMAEMEAELLRLPTEKAQKEYTKQVAEQIKEEYTPILRQMTITQGRVLLKLIDRETEHTAYDILREFRGGFVAGFWQGVSRIFGHNLKSEYDAKGEDRVIEQIVLYYEAGLL